MFAWLQIGHRDFFWQRSRRPKKNARVCMENSYGCNINDNDVVLVHLDKMARLHISFSIFVLLGQLKANKLRQTISNLVSFQLILMNSFI